MKKWIALVGLMAVVLLAGCVATPGGKETTDLVKTMEQLNETKRKLANALEELNKTKEELHRYKNFTKYYFRATASLDDALNKHDTGRQMLDAATEYYDSNDMEKVKYYAKLAQDSFHSASLSYKDAKTLFEEAAKYAPEDKLRKIVEEYARLSSVGYDLAQTLYEASENLYSAATSYAAGQYDIGDTYVDEYNKKINAHDVKVEEFQDILSEISRLIREI